jgi:nitroreductase
MFWLRKILPIRLKLQIHKVASILSSLVAPLFYRTKILSSLYYFLFSRKFDREHKAVLAGRVAYQESLIRIGETSTILRRNIHRLEKGIIMQTRRDSFAEDYIVETVKAYQRAIETSTLVKDEEKWFRDVLHEYFAIVKDTNVIAKARRIYENCNPELNNSDTKKFIPYQFSTLPSTEISYEDLHNLFIKRRSVRWYQDKQVPMELVERAINLATLAPSACNRQPYAFYVSSNKEKSVQIAKCAGGTPGWAENIPCTIAIIGDLSAYPFERDRHLIYIDGSLAAMQLMLAFETLGLSTCSINWPDIETAERKLQKLLQLNDYERPIMLLSVGFAQDRGGIPYSQKKGTEILLKKV